MSERGSAFSGLTIAVLIGLVVVTLTVIPLFTTADKVDNKTKVATQSATEEFVNEACSKGSANKDDFNKMIQTITTGLDTYSVDIQISVMGENPEKKSQLATTKRNGENVYTIYYTSQVEDYWKANDNKFPLNEGDDVTVKVHSSSSALDQNNSDKLIAEATATCTTNGAK